MRLNEYSFGEGELTGVQIRTVSSALSIKRRYFVRATTRVKYGRALRELNS